MIFHECNNESHIGPIFENNKTALEEYSKMFPSVPAEVRFGLTIFYVIAYCFIFLVVYIQLWMILCYHYKRCSFQTAFLYLCLLWSGLRATQFCYYVNGNISGMDVPLIVYWVLFCFPVCLQFFILCLLNLYFALVAFKVISKYAADPQRYIIPVRVACLLSAVLFVSMNLACAIVVHKDLEDHKEDVTMHPVKLLVRNVIVARVMVNGILFVIGAISLTCCLIKISKSNSANILLRAKGTTICRAVSIGIVIVLLYVSRSLYNLIAISPLRCSHPTVYDLDWYNVSDQAELADLKQDSSYLVYGVVLFIWEVLPTSLTVLFFKVSRSDSVTTTDTFFGKTGRVYFDKPHQPEENGDIPTSSTNMI